MPAIKHTKNELKTQRDALVRYERFLPTLQLKKHQLQLEVRRVEAKIEAVRAEAAAAREELGRWAGLFCEEHEALDRVRVTAVRRGAANIAGVAIPVFESAEFAPVAVDLFATPPWVDDGIAMLERRIRLRIERGVLEEQQQLLSDELRTTSQRVNLFEKVKIPEARENIRTIRIFLGDQFTAAVARGKIAKAKAGERAR